MPWVQRAFRAKMTNLVLVVAAKAVYWGALDLTIRVRDLIAC
jgi:hypothetical protein